MIRDVKSSYVIAGVIAAQTITVGDVESAVVDHSLANSASYFVSAGAVTGTVDMKLQWSDDLSTWTDDDGQSYNDVAMTQLSAPGTGQVNVVNPQGRYSRVSVTVGGTSAEMSVTSVAGPLRTIVPNDL